MLGPAVHCEKDTTHKSLYTMHNKRAWPQQCWKSCANGSNIVALCFGDHGTKEMLGVVGWNVWRVSNFAQQHVTAFNNMQRGVQMDTTCKIQQCWELLVNNVSFVCTQPKDRVTKVIQRFTVTPGQAYPHMSHLWIHYLKIESVRLCHNQCQIGQIPIWLQFPFQSEAKAILMHIKWIIFTRKICPQPRFESESFRNSDLDSCMPNEQWICLKQLLSIRPAWKMFQWRK